MPQEISAKLSDLPDCVLDGELLGGYYAVFDMLQLGNEDLRDRPYGDRYKHLASTVTKCAEIRIAETTWDREAKQTMYKCIAASEGEGVVFKQVFGKSVAGRPASGGSQVKCKFYATCTCLVSARNDQRSVRLSLLDTAGVSVSVGNLTIPINKTIPLVGTLVEVRYLYAYKGGSLYQPAYIGERDDLEPEQCTVSQLKYKPLGYVDETDAA